MWFTGWQSPTTLGNLGGHMPKTTYLYWIHHPHVHTDPFTEGYIGVTVNRRKRFNTHYREGNPQLKQAIKRGACMLVLESFDDNDSAYLRESEYRPNPNIGLNINKGGKRPPVQYGHTHRTTNGQKIHSQEHLADMSKKFSALRWYNNGKESKRCYEGEQPEGYTLGRAPGIKWSKEKRKSKRYHGEVNPHHYDP